MTTAKFIDRTKQVEMNITKIISNICEQQVKKAVEVAKENCPVDTGKLKESIEGTVDKNLNISFSANTDYAFFVEYGDVNNNPQPFMRPGFEEIKKIEKEVKI